MKKILFSLLASLFVFSFTSCSDDDEPEAPTNQISIKSNGKEINNNDVVKYTAETDIFGDFFAGHNTEPSFTSTTPCKLEVTVTIPQNNLKHIQWCGINHKCIDYKESGAYTRVNNEATNEAMEMHAYFKANEYTSCKVKVDVKVNNKQERTFYIEYIYEEGK